MCDNNIINLLQALLTPITAFLALYIAWRDHKTNREQIRMGLLDRRLNIHAAIMEFLSIIISRTSVDRKELQVFLYQTRQCRFLLNEEIAKLIHELYKSGSKLEIISKRLEESHKMTEEDRHKHIDQKMVLINWFNKQYEAVDVLFEGAISFRVRK